MTAFENMISYFVTAGSAAAPAASLLSFFYGGIVVLMVIAVYTIGVCWVFCGKISKRLLKHAKRGGADGKRSIPGCPASLRDSSLRGI